MIFLYFYCYGNVIIMLLFLNPVNNITEDNEVNEDDISEDDIQGIF